MFFVDLPDVQERAQIWDIVIARHKRKPTDFDTVVLARACEQFTGAEIEAVFIDAMHEAYAEGKEPGPKEILEAMARTVPLARLAPFVIGPKAARARPLPAAHLHATADACRSRISVSSHQT